MNIHARLANYISRYAPSKQKVLAYLSKKWIENPEKILQEMWYDESLMLDMWMRTFINTGKSSFEIKQKLLNKKFIRNDIEKKLQIFETEIHDWHNFSFQIQKNIENKMAKWKSKTILFQEYCKKFPYFKEEIQEFLKKFSDENALDKEFAKYSQKYNLCDKKELQKLYQALMRKGFRYDEIREKISNNL